MPRNGFLFSNNPHPSEHMANLKQKERKNMKYGAINFPIKPLMRQIEEIASMGFDYLELAMDAPLGHYSIIRQQKDDILKALDRHGMGLVCHLPTFVYTADMTESIRNASLEEMMNSLDLVAELGASKAVLHPSIISGLGHFMMETAREYAFSSFEKIAEKAERKGIRLCLENMFPRYGFLFEPEEFIQVFERFPEFGMTLDTGHANIGSPDGKRVLEFITRFGNRLRHVHISDNSGKRDDHFPIGKGTVNFQSIIQALKNIAYNDTFTLEIFTDEKDELKRNREKFAEMAE